jgi:hypothetical protein
MLSSDQRQELLGQLFDAVLTHLLKAVRQDVVRASLLHVAVMFLNQNNIRATTRVDVRAGLQSLHDDTVKLPFDVVNGKVRN